MIQASTSQTSSSLLAEAAALLFATQVGAQAQAHGVTFLADNLTLARASSTTIITDAQVPWELRQQTAEYKRALELHPKIYHVKRNLNEVAQAIRQSQSLPIFNCLNSTHKFVAVVPLLSLFKTLISREWYYLLYTVFELKNNVGAPDAYPCSKEKKTNKLLTNPSKRCLQVLD
jgi:hypothetical protein